MNKIEIFNRQCKAFDNYSAILGLIMIVIQLSSAKGLHMVGSREFDLPSNVRTGTIAVLMVIFLGICPIYMYIIRRLEYIYQLRCSHCRVKINRKLYIIADGGIKNSGDVIKAMCFSDMVKAARRNHGMGCHGRQPTKNCGSLSDPPFRNTLPYNPQIS